MSKKVSFYLRQSPQRHARCTQVLPVLLPIRMRPIEDLTQNLALNAIHLRIKIVILYTYKVDFNAYLRDQHSLMFQKSHFQFDHLYQIALKRCLWLVVHSHRDIFQLPVPHRHQQLLTEQPCSLDLTVKYYNLKIIFEPYKAMNLPRKHRMHHHHHPHHHQSDHAADY